MFTRIGTYLTILTCVCLAAGSLSAEHNRLTPDEVKAGWILLFDGETLDGWKPTGSEEGWGVENGTIANLVKGGGYLATVGRYSNFTLSLEYMISRNANSGIFFRWDNLADPVHTGIELQILDSYGKESPSSHDDGAIYDILAPRVNASKPAGEWNKVVLTCRNNLIWADLNGRRIIYMNLDRWTTAGKNPDGTRNKFRTAYKDMPREGHIGFQDHGQKVWFRNVKIRPLK